MRSPTNPSVDDIRAWAFDPDADEPITEWDLILSWGPYRSLYLDLAGDSHCPKQDYFIRFLYFLVTRSVHDNRVDEMRDFASAAVTNRPFFVHQWATQTIKALVHPETFSQATWETQTKDRTLSSSESSEPFDR